MEQFGLEKQNALTKKDKSHEQKWDEKIVELCGKINGNENYFTTSSCAGRMTLVKGTNKKIPNAFLYKSHELVNAGEIWNIISRCENENVWFRQEPCALHVACKSIEGADKLLRLAKGAGWKRSGITSISEGKVVCELVSTEWIVVPVIKDGERLIDRKFVDVLIEEGNRNLGRTWGKIEKLRRVIEKGES